MAGVLEGSRLRVWKRSVFGQAGDMIEFTGLLQSHHSGTAIEGVFRYRIQTKIQFAGLLIMGLGLASMGVYRNIFAANPDPSLLYIGGVVFLITLLWIYASTKVKHIQTEFIAEKLNAAVAA